MPLPMIPSMISTLALLLLAPTPSAPCLSEPCQSSESSACVTPSAEELELYWPDGSVRAKYSIDAQGRFSGTYVEYHENGKLKVKTHYKADRLDGKYETFWANGQRELRTSYKAGLLHGKHEELNEQGKLLLRGNYTSGARQGEFEWFTDGRVSSEQQWEDDGLVLLDGIVPYKRSISALRSELLSIYDPTVTPTAPPATEKLPRFKKDAEADLSAAERAAQDRGRDGALRRLMAYRNLCGLAWKDMRLDHGYNHYAAMAARLLVHVGKLDHTPKNPGIADDEYQEGYRGTSSSNLAMGSSLVGSIDSYMDDSDPSNIDRVGHRLWCLNPSMLRTGFGIRGRFSAMWSFDKARASVPSWELVAFPAAGYFPVEYFGDRHAWSVQLSAGRYKAPRLDKIAVRVFEVDEEYRRAEKPLELDHLGVRGIALIFRPVGVSVIAGQRYWVEIDGVSRSKKKGPLTYFVEFFNETEVED